MQCVQEISTIPGRPLLKWQCLHFLLWLALLKIKDSFCPAVTWYNNFLLFLFFFFFFFDTGNWTQVLVLARWVLCRWATELHPQLKQGCPSWRFPAQRDSGVLWLECVRAGWGLLSLSMVQSETCPDTHFPLHFFHWTLRLKCHPQIGGPEWLSQPSWFLLSLLSSLCQPVPQCLSKRQLLCAGTSLSPLVAYRKYADTSWEE